MSEARVVAREPANALRLFDDYPAIVYPSVQRDLPLLDRFELFAAANPWVEAELVRLTRDLVQRGAERVGIGMLVEVLRWQYMRSTVDPNASFKIDNSYPAFYARRIMDSCPDLAGVFETRRQPSQDG